MTNLPYKIATLIFIENQKNEQLLLHRQQDPNKGLWTPIGGKLDTQTGESPVECAIRETFEETQIKLTPSDLHNFGYLAEENYEDYSHWLIFLFHCKKQINKLPPAIKEGDFEFHSINQIKKLPIPVSDHDFLWPIYEQNKNGFTGLKIKYSTKNPNPGYKAHIESEIKIN